MKKIRCSLAYHRMPIGSFGDFAGGVRDGIFTNTTVFTLPPMTLVDFQTLIDTYINARATYKAGG
ncbi:MAG: hypothetical protein K9J17_17830 [Flavobacteriales bacterium]|nr:hypothetical protein [Flavobacteriales bacterium]